MYKKRLERVRKISKLENLLDGINQLIDEAEKIGDSIVESREVADITIKQMGGYGKLKAMLGAKNFVYGKNNISFKFPNRKRSAPNYVNIVYVPGKDLYNMEFKRIIKLDAKDIKTVNDVYADKLKDVFEHETGLRLSL